MSSPPPSGADQAEGVPSKGKKKVKIFVRRKKQKTKKPSGVIPKNKRPLLSLPPPPAAAAAACIEPPSPQEDPGDNQQDEFSLQVPLDELPCDTLLAMRSLHQRAQCLHISLWDGGPLIPVVLESQLYGLLRREDGEDSVVTEELDQLLRTNQVRRLSDASETSIHALVLTEDYLRGVWDAQVHSSDSSLAPLTSWFVTSLKQWTKRRISPEDFQEAWKNAAARPTNRSSWNEAVDLLVQMQLLLPIHSNFMLWLPHWGKTLKGLDEAKRKVIAHLKRSLYKELSRAKLEKMNYPGVSGGFVLRYLESMGLVEAQKRPSGDFIRLVSDP